ncbi:MAG: tRNA dihydrouridine synthase DusB [Candidatus Krumholzibacteria bacterium]|nr:tRNA dihydrouridine synthase DusB [Candidatus Krumholzibacteria bacterium]
MNTSETKDIFITSRVCLAPMAGFTDAPYRLICREFGADFCVTEMVSADGLVRAGDKTRRIMERLEGEGPVGVQLFGSDPGILAEAAKIVEETGPAFIDLNFGCPVKKVTRRNGGVAIMRDLDLMEQICSRVVQAVNLPVTAKIRSGWSAVEENYIEAGRVAQGAGCAAVAIHARYRTQGFSGNATWAHIAKLRSELDIPVIANGDVKEPEDYFKIVDETGCTLVMIGRGAFGRPWIFREIKDRLSSGEGSRDLESSERELSERNSSDREPPGGMALSGRLDILSRFLEMEIAWKGEKLALLEMRKFYRWFLRGHPGMKKYRMSLVTAETREAVLGHLSMLREEIENKWMKPA